MLTLIHCVGCVVCKREACKWRGRSCVLTRGSNFVYNYTRSTNPNGVGWVDTKVLGELLHTSRHENYVVNSPSLRMELNRATIRQMLPGRASEGVSMGLPV